MRQILDTIREYQMILPGMHVLAGVSGGADSVCLLLALKEYQKECDFELTVVHVEHGIRGQESMEDAVFVEELCLSLSVPCHVVHCSVPELASSGGLSVEEAARTARYQAFEDMRRRLTADVTAVAHNENDQAETVLWNLLRGSGLKGLGGMQPVREGVIRPLLFTSRADIERILRERGVGYRTDRTNLETEYTRNRLRLEILPYMEEHLNRGAVKHIAESSESLREAQDYIARRTAEAAGRCISGVPGGIILKLSEYERQDFYIQGELLRTCIRLCMGGRGLKDIGRVHIRILRELAEKPCGKMQDLPGGLTARRQEGVILFRRTAPEHMEEKCEAASGDGKGRGSMDRAAVSDGGREEYLLPENGTLTVGGLRVETRRICRKMVEPDEIFKEKKYTKWLSCDTIRGNVSFRRRRTGDYLVVNAQGGRKKLRDYMIDQKIPREERDRMWLVADGSHVLWLPGCRISEAAKVTEATETVLKITIIQTEEKAV